VLLVIAYSREARQTLRNVCRAHGETVVRQAGRVALLAETEFGAFQALRLRAKHGVQVQVERTEPFNEFEGIREGVREAARAYEARDEPATPYDAFVSGRDLPTKAEMRNREL
jgi:GMP synthase-like glutamine amidotransferase